MSIRDAFHTPSKKGDSAAVLGYISGILDPQDFEIIVTQSKGCEIVYANARAAARMDSDTSSAYRCKLSYAAHFPGICDHCKCDEKDSEQEKAPFELKADD